MGEDFSTEALKEESGRRVGDPAPGELHDEGQVFQLCLHAIEIAAHLFQAGDGVARCGSAHAISRGQ